MMEWIIAGKRGNNIPSNQETILLLDKFHEGSVFWEQGYFVGIDDLKGVSWND